MNLLKFFVLYLLYNTKTKLRPPTIFKLQKDSFDSFLEIISNKISTKSNKTNKSLIPVRNHIKLLHVYKSRRGFSKGTVLCGGY